MKKEIHPDYSEITVTCSCGHTFKTGSTLCRDLSIETCANCHPAYTGKHKAANTAGPIDKFRSRYGLKKKDENVKDDGKDAA